MSDENQSKNTSEEKSESGGDQSAAAAKDAAKDFANNAGNFFQALDHKNKIYLIALAVTALCSLVFSAFTTTVETSGAAGGLGALVGTTVGASNSNSPALLSLHHYKGAFGGKLAFLGAVAGIGILIWSTIAKRKDAWVPLAVAGAACAATLGILLTRLGMASGGGNELIKVSINGTIFGWWVPLAGAVAATVVSVQRIMKA